MELVQYALISDPIDDIPYSQRKTYGILAYSAGFQSAIRDISSYRSRVEGLIGLLNHLQVSLYHFRDVVEDFLLD